MGLKPIGPIIAAQVAKAQLERIARQQPKPQQTKPKPSE